MKKIFISHSSEDTEYVEQIVNLLIGMGLDRTQFFCTSLAGYGIPADTGIIDYLREQRSNYELHVIFVHMFYSDNHVKVSLDAFLASEEYAKESIKDESQRGRFSLTHFFSYSVNPRQPAIIFVAKQGDVTKLAGIS